MSKLDIAYSTQAELVGCLRILIVGKAEDSTVKQFWILDFGFWIDSTDVSGGLYPARNYWSKFRNLYFSLLYCKLSGHGALKGRV
jgi:hypothetical protein